MKQFTATANDEGVRLSRFVQSVTRGLPTSLLYKSFRNKRIKVNGKRAAPDARLAAGDLIELYINDEFFPPESAPARPAKPARPKQPKVQVIYEDQNIAVLYKPAHLLCHSDRTGDANLVDTFTQYLTEKGEYQPGGENRFAPCPVQPAGPGHRGAGDCGQKPTPPLRDMNEIIRTDRLKKRVLHHHGGHPAPGPVHRLVGARRKEQQGQHPRPPGPGGPPQADHHRRGTFCGTAGPYALCKIGLITGRTHQIRAHLAFLGRPVLGDIKYGNRKANERAGAKTQALCAVRISFLEIPEDKHPPVSHRQGHQAEGTPDPPAV